MRYATGEKCIGYFAVGPSRDSKNKVDRVEMRNRILKLKTIDKRLPFEYQNSRDTSTYHNVLAIYQPYITINFGRRVGESSLFHVGNDYEDTTGCELLGLKAVYIKNKYDKEVLKKSNYNYVVEKSGDANYEFLDSIMKIQEEYFDKRIIEIDIKKEENYQKDLDKKLYPEELYKKLYRDEVKGLGFVDDKPHKIKVIKPKEEEINIIQPKVNK